MSRYAELGVYLIRELGEVRLNEMTTAEIQAAIHRQIMEGDGPQQNRRGDL